MVLTYSPEVKLGFDCPEFKLPIAQGGSISSTDLRATQLPFLVVFMCNHCPYVQAIDKRLRALNHVLLALGIKMIGINSNDSSQYPEDSFANMQLKNYPFPYAIDENQVAAKSFGAVCTPDFFLFNQAAKLCYRGRLDDNWKDGNLVTRQELLEAAIQLRLCGELNLTFKLSPSMGCSIKWKA